MVGLFVIYGVWYCVWDVVDVLEWIGLVSK